MSLYHRLKRRLGHDTTTRVEHTDPLYEYTVTHLNGETSTVEANSALYCDGGFVEFYKNTSVYVWDLYDYHLSGIDTKVRTLEGIQEIEKEQIGRTELSAVVDRADGSVLKKSVEVVE